LLPASPTSARQASVTGSRSALPQEPARSKGQTSLLRGSGQLPLPVDEPRYLKESVPSLLTDVFLSYAREDKGFVQTLVAALEDAKRSVWVDWKDIPPRADWQEEINRGIEAASTFIFVLSPDSIRSEPCLKELEHALLIKKRIIPLVFRKVDPRDVHEAIQALNWIFFTQSESFDIACKQLFFALDTDLDYWHQSARLLTGAKRWEQQSKDRSRTLRGRELQEAERWLAEGAKKTPPPGPLSLVGFWKGRDSSPKREQWCRD
ncbi:MAG TPA: toll/interleukin-1 receptor domain-containing protein, partial [Ktedonobacteraceae bacterium]